MRPMTALLYCKHLEPANIAHFFAVILPICDNILTHVEVEGVMRQMRSRGMPQ
jgi:hypothetical protein